MQPLKSESHLNWNAVDTFFDGEDVCGDGDDGDTIVCVVGMHRMQHNMEFHKCILFKWNT